MSSGLLLRETPVYHRCMCNQEGTGDDFMAEAQKELKRWTLFSAETKKENALALFMKAGNAFKASMRCKTRLDALAFKTVAGGAFMRYFVAFLCFS